MRLPHDVRPVTYVQNRAAELLREVDETRRPVVITQGGEPKAVLLDFATYQEWREALLLLKLLAQGDADARAGRTVPQDQVFTQARARLSRG